MHALGEREIAFVGKRRVDEFLRVALVFVGVQELGVDHFDYGQAVFGQIKAELFLPRPVRWAAALLGD